MRPEPKSVDFGGFLELAKSAAHQAGDYLVSQMGRVDVFEKNPGDFVTQADIASERIIRELIQQSFPDHAFLGEESQEKESSINRVTDDDQGFCWIVDPLDGTTNYIHQLRSFSVSIGLRYNGQIIVGCVHDPVLSETYSATLDGGAFLNGQPIRCRDAISTERTIVVCSLPCQMDRNAPELQRMINVLCDSNATLRRLGSAALNLSYIACGRVDSYWSTFAKIWDIAAGALILTEAGGTITHIEGRPLDWNDLQFVASATKSLNQEMIDYLSIEQLADREH